MGIYKRKSNTTIYIAILSAFRTYTTLYSIYICIILSKLTPERPKISAATLSTDEHIQVKLTNLATYLQLQIDNIPNALDHLQGAPTQMNRFRPNTT
jgi:hypothetical protein